MRGWLAAGAALGALLPSAVWAQDSGDSPPPVAQERAADGRAVYTPPDFARFAPRNVLDMLNQVPGFTIVSTDQGRGLGQATDNVLVNGERLASKSESLFDQLARINTSRVVRIEIGDGAGFGIPGLSGQVANVITTAGDISGRFEYRTTVRPEFAEPTWIGGEVSLSGSSSSLEWTLAATHGTGRGGAGDGAAVIYDAAGTVIERRDVLIRFIGEFPRLSGSLKWQGPGSSVANLSANYSRNYEDSSNDEMRDLVTGVDVFRDLDNRTRSYSYEIGGDVDLAFGPGRLKLIGLERFTHRDFRSDSRFIYADASPTAGGRFAQVSDSGERIGRAEYRWDMAGGNWQLDVEAAFNRLDQVGQLFSLDPGGALVEQPFPGGSGGVTEDRYEAILTHNRTLAPGLTLQVGAGGEYSKLAQTGPGGLTRTFWRPKGSATLAWTAEPGLDLSLKLARTVGQLTFGDFLTNVNLGQNTGNAGNAQLVPPQSWELDIEAKQSLGEWGSVNVRAYGRLIQDYIDIVPVAGGLEARGNIASARRYGLDATATINLDPLGWQGAKVDVSAIAEGSSLKDPLTGEKRPFGGRDYNGEISLRYDVPQSDWAMGAGFNWTHVQPYVRLFEVSEDYEGPIYTFAFIENKNVFGLTVNLNVFNLTDGQGIFDRTVYTGLRDRSPVSFREWRSLDVSQIIRLTVKGNF